MFYVQYDGNGAITGTVSSEVDAPQATQLVFDAPVPVSNKQVNLLTLTLEDIPVDAPTP